MHVLDENQILLDIHRTFPELYYFSKEGLGSAALCWVLTNSCKIDQNRGYIQGMNYITAILLLHSDEVIAFELLEHLLNDYQLKEVYINDLEGLH